MENSIGLLRNKADLLDREVGALASQRKDYEERLAAWETDRKRRIEHIEDREREYGDMIDEIDRVFQAISTAGVEVERASEKFREQLDKKRTQLENECTKLKQRKAKLNSVDLNSMSAYPYSYKNLFGKLDLLIEESQKILDAVDLLLRENINGNVSEKNEEKAVQLIRFCDYWLERIHYEQGHTSVKPKMPAELPTGNQEAEQSNVAPSPVVPPKSHKITTVARKVALTVGEIDTECDCPRWMSVCMLMIYIALGSLSLFLLDLGGAAADDVFNPLMLMFVLGAVLYFIWFGIGGSVQVLIWRSLTIRQVLLQMVCFTSFTIVFYLLKFLQILCPPSVLFAIVYVLFVMAPLVLVSCVDMIIESISDGVGTLVMICIAAAWALLTAIVIGAFSVSGWGESVPLVEIIIITHIAYLLSLIVPFRLFGADHRVFGTISFLLPLLFMVLALVASQDSGAIGWLIFADLVVFGLSIFAAFKFSD
ncbi:MAG: hypothetical protein IJW40_02130 [Clostridia bacterium]|nr:hypothetical protein [Clostridia bacterium]